MAELHLKAGGSATAPYDTWAKSLTTIAATITAMAAGDQIDITSAYAESAAGMTLTFPGTSTAVTKLLSGTEGATSGLTALSTSGAATIESTNNTLSVSGSFYAEGIKWKNSASGVSAFPAFAGATGNQQYHRNCAFDGGSNSGTGSTWAFGSSSASTSTGVILEGCTFKLGNAGQRITLNGAIDIRGGSIDAAGTAPSGLFTLAVGNRSNRVRVDDFDASAMTASGNIVTSITQSGAFAQFHRWKMPASWTGAPVASGQIKRGDRVELRDYSIGSTLYRLWVMDYAGDIKDEATVKVTANTHSYKVVSNTDCSIIAPLRGPKYDVPLTGSAQTVTLNICTDNVTLTDAQACMEVEYFAASGASLGTIITDAAASVIATPANQTTNSVTWTTTGLTTPVRQELSVSVTAGRASRAVMRPVFRTNVTVYCDNTAAVV